MYSLAVACHNDLFPRPPPPSPSARFGGQQWAGVHSDVRAEAAGRLHADPRTRCLPAAGGASETVSDHRGRTLLRRVPRSGETTWGEASVSIW